MTQQRSDEAIRADLDEWRRVCASSGIFGEDTVGVRTRLVADAGRLLARAERAEAQVQRVEALCETEPGDENEGRISKAMLRAALGGTE